MKWLVGCRLSDQGPFPIAEKVRVRAENQHVVAALEGLFIALKAAVETVEVRIFAVGLRVNASGAAIAAGIINPLVGLGALLTQWLLKEPLARAMTARYTVTGTWSDPVLAPLDDKPAPSAKSSRVEH